MTSRELEPERRRALLEAAAREFATAGYEQASLNSVIRSQRMSKSSFYYYFDSKLALFDTVIDEASAALGQAMAVPAPQKLAGRDFWRQVERLFQRLLDVSQQGGWYVDLGTIAHLPDAPLEHSPALRRMTTAMTTWLEEALEAGRKCGAVRDDLPHSLQAELAVAVLRTLDRWSLHHADQLGRKEIDGQFAILRRLLAP